MLAIPMAFLVSGWMVPTGAKPTKGKFFDSAIIVDAEKGKLCRPDSGLGQVVSISYPHENPLFPSKSPNTVNLLLHFKNGMTAGKKFTLPDPDVSVCYFEKGDLLMFHTFEGVGSIQFDPVGGKVCPFRRPQLWPSRNTCPSWAWHPLEPSTPKPKRAWELPATKFLFSCASNFQTQTHQHQQGFFLLIQCQKQFCSFKYLCGISSG